MKFIARGGEEEGTRRSRKKVFVRKTQRYPRPEIIFHSRNEYNERLSTARHARCSLFSCCEILRRMRALQDFCARDEQKPGRFLSFSFLFFSSFSHGRPCRRLFVCREEEHLFRRARASLSNAERISRQGRRNEGNNRSWLDETTGFKQARGIELNGDFYRSTLRLTVSSPFIRKNVGKNK